MRKVKWENPNILMLGVNGTKEEPVDMYGNPIHYCHAEGVAHSTPDCTASHPANNGCKENHYWQGALISKCCCVAPTAQEPSIS